MSYTCISMTKSMIWICEKMINAYASIWRCLMHDIIIEIREKACAHVHHLEISTQEETLIFVSHYTENIMKGEEGVWGALAPQKPTE